MGKLGFFLSVIMISAIVTSLIVNIHMFRVINQLNTVNNQLDNELQKQNIERLSAWVNETVGLAGWLFGPLNYSGVLYNYLLLGCTPVTFIIPDDPNKSISTMVKPETRIIGVLWKGNEHYAFNPPMGNEYYAFNYSVIAGVVREEIIHSPDGLTQTVYYYIEAHYIRIIPSYIIYPQVPPIDS